MSCYGANFTVNGVNAGLALRGPGNGRYQVVFERELATLEQVEAINWNTPEIHGECILPKGYGFQVENITYDHGTKAYTVHLRVEKQYLGDVTGYQVQLAQLQDRLTEKDQELESVSGQLAEADEQIIALYEKLAGGQEVSE